MWSCFGCSQILTFPAVFYYKNQVRSNQTNQLYRKCKDWQVKARQPEHKRWGFHTTLHKQPFSPISDLANLAAWMQIQWSDSLMMDWGGWGRAMVTLPNVCLSFPFRESQMGVSFILATLCQQPNQNLTETPCRMLHFRSYPSESRRKKKLFWLRLISKYGICVWAVALATLSLRPFHKR